jgi:hypothetical protein
VTRIVLASLTLVLAGSASANAIAAHIQDLPRAHVAAQAAAMTATPRPVPTISTGRGAPEPRLFASISVLQHGRWIKAQTLTWTAIQNVYLGQPVLFKLAFQTSFAGWAKTKGEVEFFRAVPAHDGLPGDVEHAKRAVLRAGMRVSSHSHAYTHYRRRMVFSSRAMVGQYFVLVLARAGPRRFEGHYFFFGVQRRTQAAVREKSTWTVAHALRPVWGSWVFI